MARTVAVWRYRDGWYRLYPPGGEGEMYAFRELAALRIFAEVCGWTLKEG